MSAVVDDGGVLDVARDEHTIYLAGGFRQIGPCTGQGVPVSASTGKPLDAYPRIGGDVNAAVADEHGGWFVGGSFGRVAGSQRFFLVHVLSDGSLSSWNPQPNGPVGALCLSDDTLYVGGAFTECGGTSRDHGAAFDIRSGMLTTWNPGANAPIKSIATDGHVVYVGGEFTALDTMPRRYLGAVDRASGAATFWNPGPDSVVLSLAIGAGEVYVGGYFHSMGGMPRSLIAGVDASSGDVRSWSLSIARNPMCDGCDAGPFVDALACDGDRLYFGGSFTDVDGLSRSGAAALSLNSHQINNWNPELTGVAPTPNCRDITVNHGIVYLVGRFDGLKGTVRPYAGAVDTNGVLVGWNPKPNAPVSCAAATTTAVYIGGEFRSVWSWQPRRFLAAIDATTGDVLPWNPDPDNVVRHLCISGNTVYVTGAFETIAGKSRVCLAAIDATSGEATPWNPGVEAGIYPPIRDMVVSHGVVYVAGVFTGLAGQPRYCLGAINALTGEVKSWHPQINDWMNALAVRGDTIYLGGYFTQVNGESRNYVAAVDTTGALLSWNPNADDQVMTMAIADDLVYLGGGFNTVGGLSRNSVAAVDCGSGSVADWVVAPGFQVQALAAANHVVYVGGFPRGVEGEVRNGLAAFDSRDGSLLAWDPHPSLPNAIWALHAIGDALYVGGVFDYLGFELHPGFAAMSLALGPAPGPGLPIDRPLSIAQNAPNPARTSTTIRFALSNRARVSLSIFDPLGRRIASPLRDVDQAAGRHQIELSTTGWRPGVYYYRFDAGGATATRKMVVVN